MEFGGTDVDIETGSPVAPIRKAREEKRIYYVHEKNDLVGKALREMVVPGS